MNSHCTHTVGIGGETGEDAKSPTSLGLIGRDTYVPHELGQANVESPSHINPPCTLPMDCVKDNQLRARERKSPKPRQ